MRRAAAVGWAAILLATSCEQPRTEIVVRVDSEVGWGPGQRVQSVVLSVRRGGTDGPLRSARTTVLGAGAGRLPLPLYVGVVASDGDTDAPVWVEALGCGDPNGCTASTAAVAQRAVVRFARGQTQELPLLLASACLGVSCSSDQRCAPGSGSCESATAAQSMVGPFEGIESPTSGDAGPTDRPADGGVFADGTVEDLDVGAVPMDAMTRPTDTGVVDDLADVVGGTDTDVEPDPGRCGRVSQRCCGGVACEISLDCREGSCCAPPASPCAAAGECCDGMQCTAGRCCHAAGDRCETSIECCPGDTCSGGTCSSPAAGCGATGQPCCAGDSCQSGSACVGAVCAPCGGTGQPCCPRATCVGTLACVADACQAPAPCGDRLQPCCAGGVCNGDLACSGATCVAGATSLPVGSTCTLGSSTACSIGTTCGDAHGSDRCCRAEAGRCTSDTDCCGELSCRSGTCQRNATGGGCSADRDCASGLTCQSGQCQMAGAMCVMFGATCTGGSTTRCCGSLTCTGTGTTGRCCNAAGGACAGAGDCCNGLSCTGGMCACSLAGQRCSASSDCCGDSVCTGGMCACRARGQSCSGSADCCSGLTCNGGVCSMCASAGSSCTAGTGTACCSPAQCRQGITSTFCCVQQGEGCTRDIDCCGYMSCASGRCACRAENASCRESNECCTGLSCQSGSCRRTAMDGGTSGDGGGISIDLPRIDSATGDARVDGATSDGETCLAPASRCTQGATACCGDYSCGQQPAGAFCCHPAMGSCATSVECCGFMLCTIPSGQTRGTCACRRRNEVCANALDCCGGARCNISDGGTSGTCVCSREFETCSGSEGCCDGFTCRNGRCLTAGCLAPGERCDNTDAGTCCGGYACNVQPSGQSTCSRGPALVTSDPPTTCMMGSECAGSVLCTGGVCVCRRGGESCFYSNDCCGAMLCTRGDAGAPSMGTCQCQASGNGCRIGGNDCCSGQCRSSPTGDRCP